MNMARALLLAIHSLPIAPVTGQATDLTCTTVGDLTSNFGSGGLKASQKTLQPAAA
jgi:hypothetical protein